MSSSENQERTGGITAGACFTMHGNTRVFAKAIMALNKVGEELYLEPNEEGLALRALNSSKSAYASFLFSTTFFVSCNVAPIIGNQRNLCRISMKCALSAFRGVRGNDKQVLSCKLYINPKADSMLVQLTHTYDVIKSLEIAYLDCSTTFRHTINKADLANCIVGSSFTISNLFSQMRQDSDEVMMCAKGDSFIMRNFTSRELEPDKMMKTEVKVGVVEFERYSVPKATEITVNLREIKALVSFAETYQASTSLYFDHPGRPMVLALESNVNFTSELVIATVDMDTSMLEPSYALESQETSQSTSSIAPKRKLSIPSKKDKRDNPITARKEYSVPPIKPRKEYSVPSAESAESDDDFPTTPPLSNSAAASTSGISWTTRTPARDEYATSSTSSAAKENALESHKDKDIGIYDIPDEFSMNSSAVVGLCQSRSVVDKGSHRQIPSSSRFSSTGTLETARTGSASILRTPPRAVRREQGAAGGERNDSTVITLENDESGQGTAGKVEATVNDEGSDEDFPESPPHPHSLLLRPFFVSYTQRMARFSQIAADKSAIAESTLNVKETQ